MSARWVAAARAGSDGCVAAASAALLGSGAFLVFTSLFNADLVVAAVGAGVASLSLFVLFASGWVPMLPVLAASLALPPAYASEAIRLGPALLVTLLVVFAWTLGRGLDAQPLALGRMPVGAVVVFIGWVVISAGFAADRGSAARETANLMLFFGFLVAATDLLLTHPGRVRSIALVLGWVAGFAGGLAVLETLGAIPGRFVLPGTALYRAAGGFGWPNELAMYLAMSLPFTVFVLLSAATPAGRTAALLALTLAVAGLGATFSRGSWIATIVAPGALLLVGQRGLAVRVWLFVLIAALALDLASGGAISGRVVRTLADPLVGQRFLLTRAGVLMFLSHPLVGVGPGGFEAALDEFGLLIPGLFDFVGSAHNTYVHIAAETGLVGAFAFLTFLVVAWWTSYSAARSGAGVGGERALLTSTLLWSFTTASAISLAEWTLAHGPAQVIMLAAAMAFALDAEAPP